MPTARDTFSPSYPNHPGDDRGFCRNRARRSPQSGLPTLVGHLPATGPAHRTTWATAAGLCPRQGQLRRRGERRDWLDILEQRACLHSLALGRDIPSRCDHFASHGVAFCKSIRDRCSTKLNIAVRASFKISYQETISR